MKYSKRKFFSYTTTLLLVAFSLTFYSVPILLEAQTSNYAPHRTGEFLVKFKNDPEIYTFKAAGDLELNHSIQEFSQEKIVELIEPNYTFEASAFPSDPDFYLQYYLGTINARSAWSQELLTREQESITRRSVVAVLDTGVDMDHPDLVDKIWKNLREIPGNNRDDDNNGFVDDVKGWDFVDQDADPNPSLEEPFDIDAVKHGTIVSGLIGASSNNNIGITGVGWYVDIMPLRVLDSNGSGDVGTVVAAINYAIKNGANLINMSFVGNGQSLILQNAIQQAYDNNVIVVAAAGNTDPEVNGVNLNITKAYPVCYKGNAGENIVIGVASVDPNLKKSGFSNYGECIDISTPGEGFYATQVFEPSLIDFNRPYDGFWSGTSLSAPLVSGSLATIKALRPGLSISQIEGLLATSAKNINSFNPGFENQLGSGLLDFNKLLGQALSAKATASLSGKIPSYLIAGLGYKSFPQIKVLKADGSEFKSFFSYNPSFNGSINIAAGDLDGDGQVEVVTGAGAGGGPHVRVMTIEGQVISQFFAYEEKFRGGINVAVGDVTGDGKAEIITGAGAGIIPEVKVFDLQGKLLSKFLAYGEGFLGGVKVAAGDINGDGKAEIITGAGAGGGPQVRTFEYDGRVVSQFFAYNQNFKGGVNVAAGDLNNDGRAEIIVAVETNSVPTVRAFDLNGTMITNFFAYDPSFLAGVNVAAGDVDGDGVTEIITGKAVGDGEVKIFNVRGDLEKSFNVYPSTKYKGGVRPAVLK